MTDSRCSGVLADFAMFWIDLGQATENPITVASSRQHVIIFQKRH